jgi:SSS family solute:Na+ symporter
MVTGFDLFIVIFFIAGVFAVGVYFKKYIHTSEDFFLAGRKLAWWVIGMSIIGTNIGSYDYVGGAGNAYNMGIAQANFEWIGAIPAMVISALLFIPYYWRAGVYTVPEYLGKRYNQAVRTIEAVLWGVFLVAALSIFFYASGAMIHEYLGWNIWLGIILTAVVVGVYTVSGGLTAVTMTDVIQFVVMLVGALALAVIGFHAVGGWEGLVAKVGARHPDHFKLFLPMDHADYPWLGVVLGLGLVLSPAWWCCHQAMIQRTLGARSEWDAKAGMMSATFLKTLVPLLIVLPGLFVVALFDDGLAKKDFALPWAIKTLLPMGLSGLVFAAFIAAIFSTVDSTLNSAATIWTRDIYQNFIRKNASDKHYLLFGRVLTVVLIVIAVPFATYTERYGIYNSMQKVLTIFQGATLATVLLGIMWRRSTQWGGLTGLVVGVAFSATLTFASGLNFLYIAWWSFVLSVVVNVVVSYLTKPEPTEKLRGLVYGLVMKDDRIQKNLSDRVEGGE